MSLPYDLAIKQVQQKILLIWLYCPGKLESKSRKLVNADNLETTKIPRVKTFWTLDNGKCMHKFKVAR